MLSALAVAWLTGASSLEPNLLAARALGYTLVGESRFAARSITLSNEALGEQVRAVRESCPRAPVPLDRALKKSHLVVLAWADREFPTRQAGAHATTDVALANGRARWVAERLRHELGGALEFDLINMAERRPQSVRVLDGAQLNGPTFDVKAALHSVGAAPSTPLELGLFGEYAQRSKVVVWADCAEPLPTRTLRARVNFALARR